MASVTSLLEVGGAADTYRALTEARAYRSAQDGVQAAATVRSEARAGRVQHIYDKLGVATRAGAMLSAAQHDLLHHDPVGPSGYSATSGRPFVTR